MRFKTNSAKLSKNRAMELKYYCLQYRAWEVGAARLLKKGENSLTLNEIIELAIFQDRIEDIQSALRRTSPDEAVRDAIFDLVTNDKTAINVCVKDAPVCYNTLLKLKSQFFLHLDERHTTKVSTCERFNEDVVIRELYGC